MKLSKIYDPATAEPQLQASWQEKGTYLFSNNGQEPIYSIDTPPPTVSGNLHLGHIYSYSQTDFMARFWRMNGYNVFYPMGYDDNGLPTERLVEKRRGIRAAKVGRKAFIAQCLEVSEEAEKDYQAIWQRFGLSVDWRYSYRSIDDLSRRTSQLSFVDLYHKGLVYRQSAPTIWCPECHTAIAQAEVNDLERQSEFVTLAFHLLDGTTFPISTTRPELLSACVAVFVHPGDTRFSALIGQTLKVPLFDLEVPILEDNQADPEKGTGAVMCCTFGDTADVEWWRVHNLPLRIVIGRDGRLTEAAGDFAGLTVIEARKKMIETLDAEGMLLGRQLVMQSVRVHERDDTPVEYIVTQQWFIRVLDFKPQFLTIGEQVSWHPAHMYARYQDWVENLRWDWCISRQRYFGVPFPVWYCNACGEIRLAEEERLPVDPMDQQPTQPCACGNAAFTPEQDVMDTWATSALSPQIVGRWLTEPALYERVFPMSLRPQAHEIIRTWAFDTIVKSWFHFSTVPWKAIAISGWGLSPAGTGKISKSRGGGPLSPNEALSRYSADAVRYWAASTGFGKDSVISQEKMQVGAKLVTKLWNVARFSESFLDGYTPQRPPLLTPADSWILSRTQRLVQRVTECFQGYDYATAKSEIESFFWTVLTDNYLEMVKTRLYDETGALRESARYTLYTVLLTIIKLFAPFLPHITEQIYLGLFSETEGNPSIHRSPWPSIDRNLLNEQAESFGQTLVELATAVRRFKSEANIALGARLPALHLAADDTALADLLREAEVDIRSVSRASKVVVSNRLPSGLEVLQTAGAVALALGREVN